MNAEKLMMTAFEGILSLVFAKTERGTQLLHQQTLAPLKVQRPFFPEGKEFCHTVVVHTAGGMVGGDRLSWQLQLQPGAKTLITTVAASKVYRSTGLVSQQSAEIEIQEGGILEWFPQETIIFNGANYRQDLRVELAPNARWLGWDITRFGRSARGERFLEGSWRSNTEVWREGIPLWLDRQQLQGGGTQIDNWHSLAGYPVVANFAFVGQPVSGEIVQGARNLWTGRDPSGRIGVTRLMSGLLCRYRGASSQSARSWLIDVWNLLRLTYLNRPACCPRVWI
jgi:urease accessory protein